MSRIIANVVLRFCMLGTKFSCAHIWHNTNSWLLTTEFCLFGFPCCPNLIFPFQDPMQNVMQFSCLSSSDSPCQWPFFKCPLLLVALTILKIFTQVYYKILLTIRAVAFQVEGCRGKGSLSSYNKGQRLSPWLHRCSWPWSLAWLEVLLSVSPLLMLYWLLSPIM